MQYRAIHQLYWAVFWIWLLSFDSYLLDSDLGKCRKKKLVLARETHFGSDVIVQSGPKTQPLIWYLNRTVYVTEYMWQWGKQR